VSRSVSLGVAECADEEDADAVTDTLGVTLSERRPVADGNALGVACPLKLGVPESDDVAEAERDEAGLDDTTDDALVAVELLGDGVSDALARAVGDGLFVEDAAGDTDSADDAVPASPDGVMVALEHKEAMALPLAAAPLGDVDALEVVDVDGEPDKAPLDVGWRDADGDADAESADDAVLFIESDDVSVADALGERDADEQPLDEADAHELRIAVGESAPRSDALCAALREADGLPLEDALPEAERRAEDDAAPEAETRKGDIVGTLVADSDRDSDGEFDEV
jgi:hypothetical protein